MASCLLFAVLLVGVTGTSGAAVPMLPLVKFSANFVLPSHDAMISGFAGKEGSVMFTNPMEQRMANIQAAHTDLSKAFDHASHEDIEKFNAEVHDLLQDATKLKTTQNDMIQKVDDQANKLDESIREVQQINNKENEERKQADKMGELYNIAIPIANAQSNFAKSMLAQTEDAEKVEEYESQETNEFEGGLHATATAVVVVDSILKDMKETTLPQLQGVNASQKELYDLSAAKTEECNALTRRLVDAKGRTAKLREQLDNATTVLMSLLQLAASKITNGKAVDSGQGVENTNAEESAGSLMQVNETAVVGADIPDTILAEIRKRQMRYKPEKTMNEVAMQMVSRTGMADIIKEHSDPKHKEAFAIKFDQLLAPELTADAKERLRLMKLDPHKVKTKDKTRLVTPMPHAVKVPMQPTLLQTALTTTATAATGVWGFMAGLLGVSSRTLVESSKDTRMFPLGSSLVDAWSR